MRGSLASLLIALSLVFSGCGDSGASISFPIPGSEQVNRGVVASTPVPDPTVTPGSTPAPTQSPVPVLQGALTLDLSTLDLSAYHELRARLFDKDDQELYNQAREAGATILLTEIPVSATRLEVSLLVDGIPVARQQLPVVVRPEQTTPVSVGSDFSAETEAALSGPYAVYASLANHKPGAPPVAGHDTSSLRGEILFDGSGELSPGTHLEILHPDPNYGADDQPPSPATAEELTVTGGTYEVDPSNRVRVSIQTEEGKDLALEGCAISDQTLPLPATAPSALPAQEYLPSSLVSALVEVDDLAGAALLLKPAEGPAPAFFPQQKYRLIGTLSSGMEMIWNSISFSNELLFFPDAEQNGHIASHTPLTFKTSLGAFHWELKHDGEVALTLDGDSFELDALQGEEFLLEGTIGRNGVIAVMGRMDPIGAILTAQIIPQAAYSNVLSDLLGDYQAVRFTKVPSQFAEAILTTFQLQDNGRAVYDGQYNYTYVFRPATRRLIVDQMSSLLYFSQDNLYGLIANEGGGTPVGWMQLVRPKVVSAESPAD